MSDNSTNLTDTPAQESGQTYAVAAVAKALGIAPATLRTWARRHGVGPTVHTTGTHRRYGESDIARLFLMRSFILRGATASEAAKLSLTRVRQGISIVQAREAFTEALIEAGVGGQGELSKSLENHAEAGALSSVPVEPVTPIVMRSGLTPEEPGAQANAPELNGVDSPEAESQLAYEESIQDNAEDGPVPLEPRRLRIAVPDESVIEPTDYGRRASELVAAALRDDIPKCTELIRVHPTEDIILWWKLFLRPALDRLENQTVLAAAGHHPRVLLGYLGLRAIQDFVARSSADAGATAASRMHPSRLKNIALVFTIPADELALPAHVLAAALLDKNCNAHVVSGSEKEDRALELVRMIRPSCVVFETSHGDPDVDFLRRLDEAFPSLPIYVGPGADVEVGDLVTRPHVIRIRSFMALFHEVYGTLRSKSFDADYWDDSQGVLTAR